MLIRRSPFSARGFGRVPLPLPPAESSVQINGSCPARIPGDRLHRSLRDTFFTGRDPTGRERAPPIFYARLPPFRMCGVSGAR